MTVELPKDAEGREIPPDTVVPYGKEGKCLEVNYFTYPVVQTMPGPKWGVVFMNRLYGYCSSLHPTPPEPPDGWEKPLEDLAAAGDARHQGACAYLNRDKDVYCCTSCPCGRDGRVLIAMRGIADRIRKLGGGGDEWSRALFGNDDAPCNLDSSGPGMWPRPADPIDNRR